MKALLVLIWCVVIIVNLLMSVVGGGSLPRIAVGAGLVVITAAFIIGYMLKKRQEEAMQAESDTGN